MANKMYDIFTEIGERDSRLVVLLLRLIYRPIPGMKLVFFGQDMTEKEVQFCLGLRLRRSYDTGE